jgi:hypothetical protein
MIHIDSRISRECIVHRGNTSLMSVRYESAKYYAIGKPLWSRAEREHRLEPLPDGRTRVHFVERYYVFNPLMRLLLERRVHHFISKDNDKLVRDGIVSALAARRRGAHT